MPKSRISCIYVGIGERKLSSVTVPRFPIWSESDRELLVMPDKASFYPTEGELLLPLLSLS